MYSSGSKKLPLSILWIWKVRETAINVCPSPLHLNNLYSYSISQMDPLLRSNGVTFLWINLKAERHKHLENPGAPELVLENFACNFPLMQVASLDKD